MVMTKKNCKYCGKEFEIHSSQIKYGRGKFCSTECFNKAKSEFEEYLGENAPRWDGGLVKIKCKFCGKEFKGHKLRKFCSVECSRKGQIYHTREDHWKYNPKIEVQCEYCGKIVERNEAKLKGNKHFFCSQKCKANAQVGLTGSDCPSWKEKIKIFCKYCGKEMLVTEWEKDRKFCSKGCKKLFCVGPNASAWLGGISFEPYTSEFNETLKAEIRDRDNHTCQLCKDPEKGRKLPVHHIDYNKKNTDPFNLISFCISCHAKTRVDRNTWTEVLQEYQNEVRGYE